MFAAVPAINLFPGAENVYLRILRENLKLDVLRMPITLSTGIGYHTDV